MKGNKRCPMMMPHILHRTRTHKSVCKPSSQSADKTTYSIRSIIRRTLFELIVPEHVRGRSIYILFHTIAGMGTLLYMIFDYLTLSPFRYLEVDLSIKVRVPTLLEAKPLLASALPKCLLMPCSPYLEKRSRGKESAPPRYFLLGL